MTDNNIFSLQDYKVWLPKPHRKGDGIKEAVLKFLSKWPTATPEQIGHQLGVQPELVERIIEADKKRKMDGY